MSDHRQNVQAVYGCDCGECRRKYEAEQQRRNPYYRPPHQSSADSERELYANCRRDPYARDPYDDGAAGW